MEAFNSNGRGYRSSWRHLASTATGLGWSPAEISPIAPRKPAEAEKMEQTSAGCAAFDFLFFFFFFVVSSDV